MQYARRVCLTRYPLRAGEIAKQLNILREGDTLIFRSPDVLRAFNRRVRELFN